MLNLNERVQNQELLRRQREERLAGTVGRGDAKRHASREARPGNSFRQLVREVMSRFLGGGQPSPRGIETAAVVVVPERDHAA